MHVERTAVYENGASCLLTYKIGDRPHALCVRSKQRDKNPAVVILSNNASHFKRCFVVRRSKSLLICACRVQEQNIRGTHLGPFKISLESFGLLAGESLPLAVPKINNALSADLYRTAHSARNGVYDREEEELGV